MMVIMMMLIVMMLLMHVNDDEGYGDDDGHGDDHDALDADDDDFFRDPMVWPPTDDASHQLISTTAVSRK